MRERRLDPRREEGFTLVELLVTISILALVMGAVTTAVVATQRTVRETDQRYTDLGEARVAMNATSRNVRTAIRLNPGDPAFIDAGPEHLEFYANVDVGAGDPKRVRLDVQGDDLLETVEDGTVGSGAGANPVRTWTGDGAPRTRTIARNLTNPTDGEPLFEYFAQGASTPFATPGDQLPAADQGDVRQVRIELRVDSDAVPDVAETVLANRVRIPNFYFVNTPGGP